MSQSRVARASLYQSSGNLDGAIQDYTTALEIGHTDAKLKAKTLANRALAYRFRSLAYAEKHDAQHAASDEKAAARLASGA